MKESELEIKELDDIRKSMSATGKKQILPKEYSDIYYYIIANAELDDKLQSEVVKFIKSKGKTANVKNAPKVMREILSNMDKDEALKVLASLHPDKELIITQYKKDTNVLNACGCTMGADGETTEKTASQKANKIVVVGLSVALVSLIALIITND